MWGEKSRTIERLGQEIIGWRECRDKMATAIDELRGTIKERDEEAIRRIKINVELTGKIAYFKEQLDGASELNDQWSRDYRDLNNRYTLLDSLLKQLHVNVTLPAKKTARQN